VPNPAQPTVIDETNSVIGESKRPLKIGLNLPIVEGTFGGKTAQWADLVAYAQQAEALGFDSLWLPDHLLLRWQEQTRGIWECWSLLSALTAATSRIQLGTLVLCSTFRNPALLAKMADTVDEISGGRLILGLGAGWDGPEYRAFGYPEDHRFARFEEALQIIVPLLRTGHVDFSGRYYQAQDCALRPRGPRSGGPPIMIGAKGPRMLRLAATYADYWNAEGPLRRPADFAQQHTAGDAACTAVGRDSATLRRSASVVLTLAPEHGQPGPAEPLSTEQLAATFSAYAQAGLDHIQLWPTPNTPPTLETLAAVLDRLDQGQG
jgi:alkanesulfonate monooxygenase SsuD/methylene tetrahydromethanopterin reductase-like flavin-dependent oxidoreductase (luciferase family)